MSNLSAFLRVIREGETNQDDTAYRMLYGGNLVSNLSQHPNTAVTAAGYTSTAAGAYQFLYRTWEECRKALNLPDFSPESQDKAAVFLIERRSALQEVKEGRFEEAIRKCNREWASLPGSPYGQPTMTIARCRQVYEQYGGTYSTDNSVTIEKEKPMNPMFIDAAISAISTAIPALNKVFHGSENAERNTKAAEVVVNIAKEALGAKNEQEVVEAMNSPDSANTVRNAVEARWFEVVEAGGGGIAGARKAAVEASESFWKNPAFVITMTLFPLIYGTVAAVLFGGDSFPPDLKIMVVTAVVSGVLNGIMGFWLGTSMSSSRKTELLSKR